MFCSSSFFFFAEFLVRRLILSLPIVNMLSGTVNPPLSLVKKSPLLLACGRFCWISWLFQELPLPNLGLVVPLKLSRFRHLKIVMPSVLGTDTPLLDKLLLTFFLLLQQMVPNIQVNAVVTRPKHLDVFPATYLDISIRHHIPKFVLVAAVRPKVISLKVQTRRHGP